MTITLGSLQVSTIYWTKNTKQEDLSSLEVLIIDLSEMTLIILPECLDQGTGTAEEPIIF